MAFYLEASKGCFFFLGAGKKDGAPLHNARFNPPEEILTVGVESFCRVVEMAGPEEVQIQARTKSSETPEQDD